jgi:hypothetical protein
MADLGDGKPARNRTQTNKHARPAMKLTAKEDAATMAIVSEYWTEELAPHKCWAVMEVATRGVYLIHNVNRTAGDYHAVTAMLSHQGSTSSSPCIWCNSHQMHYGTKSRLCPVCERYCCQHLALRRINIAPELLETKQIPLVDLAAPPVHLRETIEVSHGANQPRRQKKADAAQKAATAQAKRGHAAPPPSNHTAHPLQAPAPTTGTSQAPGLVGASTPMQSHASASDGPPLSGWRQNPLDKQQAVPVHPEVCRLGRVCFVWNCSSQVGFVVTTIVHNNVNAKGVIHTFEPWVFIFSHSCCKLIHSSCSQHQDNLFR